jgi:hypothetical protein
MVTEAEVNHLREAFKEVLKEVQVFERQLADPTIIFQIASMAQGIIYNAGVQHGYDWRGIHIVVNIADGRYAYIDPRPLSPYYEELVQKAMEV